MAKNTKKGIDWSNFQGEIEYYPLNNNNGTSKNNEFITQMNNTNLCKTDTENQPEGGSQPTITSP